MTLDEQTQQPDDKTLLRFISQPCDFVLAAAEPAHLLSLPGDLPEVAFWGRSNVGKSSLINAVMGRKALARTSNTPGRTRQIIFFNLADQLMLADLPGYGYAKAPKKEIAQWEALIQHYMQTRVQLRCVFLLIDGRHGFKPVDEEMLSLLDRLAVSTQIVATKTDQVKEDEREKRLVEMEALIKKHPAARPHIVMTSAAKGQGLAAVRAQLFGLSS